MPQRTPSPHFRSDTLRPIQVQLVAPVVTTTHAKPVTGAPLPTSLPAIAGQSEDIEALIDASDNPLEFFLTPETVIDGSRQSAAAALADVFPTPEALEDSEDGDYFIDSGIEGSQGPTPPMRTVSPSQLLNMARTPSPPGLPSAIDTVKRHSEESRRPHSPHPRATGALSSHLAPPPPSASAPNTLIPPRHGRLGRASPPPPRRVDFPFDDPSDSDSDCSSIRSVRSVPASIDANDGEDYIHFLAGGVGMAGTSYRVMNHLGSDSSPTGANPHSYPPYTEYTPLTKFATQNGKNAVHIGYPSRAMNPTARRRGRSLKAHSRRGVVAHGGRWRWAAREPSPDVWSIEEDEAEYRSPSFEKECQPILVDSVGSIMSREDSFTSGVFLDIPRRRDSPVGLNSTRRSISPVPSFGQRGASPASTRSYSSGDDEMGLKKLRITGPDEGEVKLLSGRREVFAGDSDGEDESREQDCRMRIRRVRFVLP